MSSSEGGPAVHLDCLSPGATAVCGAKSKHLTRSATAVTCWDCKQTWLYATLIDRLVERWPRKPARAITGEDTHG